MCTVANCVVLFILHVYVSCRFLMGSLQLPLLCFCNIMLCVQLSLFIIYSAGVFSSRKGYIVLNLVSVVQVDPL